MSDKRIITISRQYASGGRSIGEKLAGKLSIPFYDNNILALAAQESGFNISLFERADEKATGSLLYSFSLLGNPNILPEIPLNDKLFFAQAETIRKVAAEGACVIVGRCANYILREIAPCVNIYIYSDMNSRTKRAVEEYGQDEAKAKEIITKYDKKRATYYNYYTDLRWGRAEDFDLCINSGTLGIEDSVQLIEEYLRHL